MFELINYNKINMNALKEAISKPELFKKSTDKFWNDEYIADQMLKYHLNPEVEAASKTKNTIEAEADFIIRTTQMNEKKSVIDLGCGPGLYVKEFSKTGANVIGVDISDKSIQYAKEHHQNNNASFYKMNYLDLNYKETFHIATLIFYDFCALNTCEQSRLLTRINSALKEDGLFILDVLTGNRKIEVNSKVSIVEGGFWSPEPYMEIFNSFIYEEPKTEGLQYTIINEEGTMKVIRIYHRLFDLEEIRTLFNEHNFEIERVYRNLRGEKLYSDSETYGIIARKK